MPNMQLNFGEENNTSKDYLVTQDNKLLMASYSLTLNEQRLLFLAISKVDSRKRYGANEALIIKITAKDWGKVFKDSNSYTSLSRACSSIFERQLRIKLAERDYLKLRWVAAVRYTDIGEAQIELTFPPQLVPYLTGLARLTRSVGVRKQVSSSRNIKGICNRPVYSRDKQKIGLLREI